MFATIVLGFADGRHDVALLRAEMLVVFELLLDRQIPAPVLLEAGDLVPLLEQLA